MKNEVVDVLSIVCWKWQISALILRKFADFEFEIKLKIVYQN